ncbi:MAG: single-stranded DNA-binding protein [Calditrichaeota bacterium]|nr:MAG: single-stranded DNA-binding protein [Calditrichota bacterium]
MAELKMPDVNMVLIAGNLTSAPSFRRTTNGTPVANFYIASNRRFKDNTGQWRESVCYVGIVAWYKLAESCHQNLQKGSAVVIDGELQSRAWKNEDGTSKNVVEIKARRIQFLNKRKNDDASFDDKYDDSTIENDYIDQTPDDEEKSNDETGVPKDDDFNFGYEDLTF